MLQANQRLLNYFYAILSIFSIEYSLASQNSQQDLSLTRLVTDAEHKSFLISTLDKCAANDSLMISSYDISPRIFHNDNIAGHIIDAACRGVRIYIYYEHEARSYSNEDLMKLRALISLCAKYEQNCNHSKCVVKNKELTTIGSYNWLSDFNDTSANGSTVISGPICRLLNEDIWQGMRFYQCIQHDNEKGIQKFINDEKVFFPKLYNIARNGQLTILRTPEAHNEFLHKVFLCARSAIHIFSPFIRFNKLTAIFTAQTLSNNVRTVLVTLPNCCKNPQERANIFTYLDNLQNQHPYFSYKILNDFHAKTLVCDDMICEGSFNWLSAVDQIDHDANNYEVSVAIKGAQAAPLLESFRTSAIGQAVMAQEVAANDNSPHDLSIPKDFKKHIRLFMNRNKGICVQLDGEDIQDGNGNTMYFKTKKEAKQIAYQMWLENQDTQPDNKRERSDSSQETSSPVKHNRTDNAPENLDDRIKIYSGAKYNKNGFCVKIDGEYIRDSNDAIVYYQNRSFAKQVAYELLF